MNYSSVILCTCLIPAVCAATVPAEAAAPKVLFQTSFEEGKTGDPPAGWEALGKAPNRVLLSADQAHTGKRSLRLIDASTTESCGARSPRILVKPNTDYGVTWWFRAAEGSVGSLYVEFRREDGTRIEGEGVHILSGRATGRWERTVATVPSPAAAASLTVLPYCYTTATTDAYYDDITVVEGVAETYDRTPLPPAAVKHPCGLYREADIQRARENIRRHEWARKTLAGFRSQAGFWMGVPDDQIATWIPELTPNSVVDCPECGANWDYAWKAQPDMSVRCTRCSLTLPSPDYPENARETLTNPLGQKVEYPYHQDAKGKRYYISGLLAYQRIGRLNSLGALGKVYALTGEEAYAEKAVKVLRRVAQVYPGYVPHDWDHFYRDYSNLQSGKLAGWKLFDAGTFTQLGTCYDLIANSGCLTTADRVLIENGAFREAIHLFTATSPKGCCINDGPYAMTCGALLGAILGDHDAVSWAISRPDGFLGFVHRYFFRDGHWEDGSSSYESMALGPLYGCPEILQGYSDPPSYRGEERFDNLDLRQDPILRKIYTAQLRILMPDGTAPAVNDSSAGARFSPAHVETNYFWYPTEENRRILAQVYGGKLEAGGEYALFRRDPELSLEGVAPLNLAAGSLVQPGLGLAILRAGEGEDAAALYLDYGPSCSGHGHPDKLNIIYYDHRAELVSDQGYLGWRHEITPWNQSTLPHNEVLVDGQPQAKVEGKLLVFQPSGPIRTIVAEAPAAYPQATRYERSVSLVDHGPGRRYVVDVFRVVGGKAHDFVLHGAGRDFSGGEGPWLALADVGISDAAGAKWIRQATYQDAAGQTRATWSEAGKAVTADLLGQPGTRVLHLVAPGQRHRNDPWEKRDLHLLVARRGGPANTFVSVLRAAGEGSAPLVVTPEAVEAEKGDVRALRVKGPGFDDLVVVGEAASAAGLTRCGELSFRGQLAYLSRTAEGATAALLNGSELQAGGIRIASTPQITGKVTAVDADACTVRTDVALPAGKAAPGQQLILEGVTDGAYEIESVEPAPGGGSVVRLAGQPMMSVTAGQQWTYSTFATVAAGMGR